MGQVPHLRAMTLVLLFSLWSCESDREGTPSPAADGGAGGALPDEPPLPKKECTDDDPSPCPPLNYAVWPMPHPPSLPLPNPARLDVTRDTATDLVTGLMWQRSFTEKVDLAQARNTCENLQLAGHDDWRLPSRIELVSIVDFSRRPSIDEEAFAGTPQDYFWTSSLVAADGSVAYSVYFGAGNTTYASVSGTTGHSRCVRGGGPGDLPRFVTDDETVVDRNTGLVWQRTVPLVALSHQGAERYCEDLVLGSWSSFRLPSTKELQTIVDETRSSPAIDEAIFPDTESERFWTSSRFDPASGDDRVHVEFAEGTTERSATGDVLWVRCVD